jgi:hypothetical protein
MILLSVTGVIKMILMLLGAFVALRFIGQLMQAKRNIAEENQFKAQQNQINREKAYVDKFKGKTSIIPKNVSNSTNLKAEDVPFQEVKE